MPRRRRNTFVAVLVFLVASASCIVLREFALDARWQVLLGGLGVTFAGVAPLPALPRPRWLSVHTYVLLGAAGTLGFGSLSWLGNRPTSFQIRVGIDGISSAHDIALIGIASYSAVLFVSRSFSSRSAEMKEVRSDAIRGVVPGLVVVGLAVRLLRVVQGRSGYIRDAQQALVSASPLDQALSLAEGLLAAGILVGAYLATRDKRRTAFFVILSVAFFDAGIGLIAGVRQQTVVPFLLVLLGAGLARRPSIRSLVGASLALLMLLNWVFPSVNAYRNALRPGDRAPVVGLDALAYTDALLGAGDGGGQIDGLVAATARASTVGGLSVAVSAIPERVPWLGLGRLFSDVATAPIPRAVWPDKPILAPGQEVARTLFGATTQTSSTITWYGYAYRYAGIISVIMGIGLLAFLLSILERTTAQSRLERLIILALLAPNLLKQEAAIHTFAASLLQVVVVILAIRLFLRVRPRRSGS